MFTPSAQGNDLPGREGRAVKDHWLEAQAETDDSKAGHKIETVPQLLIDGKSIVWR